MIGILAAFEHAVVCRRWWRTPPAARPGCRPAAARVALTLNLHDGAGVRTVAGQRSWCSRRSRSGRGRWCSSRDGSRSPERPPAPSLYRMMVLPAYCGEVDDHVRALGRADEQVVLLDVADGDALRIPVLRRWECWARRPGPAGSRLRCRSGSSTGRSGPGRARRRSGCPGCHRAGRWSARSTPPGSCRVPGTAGTMPTSVGCGVEGRRGGGLRAARRRSSDGDGRSGGVAATHGHDVDAW